MQLPDDPGVRFVAAEPVWQLATVAPDVAAVLPEPLRDGPDRLPALRAYGYGESGPYVRPPGHRRAFYTVVPDAGCVGIKGTEVHCDDLGDWARSLEENRVWVTCETGSVAHGVLFMSAELRGLDKWPVLEGKFPCAVTLPEALGDANAAVQFQRAHLARYGELARVPVPLVVYRHPDEAVARAVEAIAPHLSARARDMVGRIAAHGLGAYVYHYPTVPHRVAFIQAPDLVLGFSPGAVFERLTVLTTQIDVDEVVARWVTLVARMLALGFLPTDPTAVVIGNCLQMQNAVIDGGFVNLGSLHSIATVRDERELRDALRRTFSELAETILRLFVGALAPTKGLRERLPDLYAAVAHGIATELAGEPAESLDPMLRRLVLEPGPVAEEFARILLAFD